MTLIVHSGLKLQTDDTVSYLAANADEQQSLHVQCFDGGQHVQVGRQRRLHALRRKDILFTPRDHL